MKVWITKYALTTGIEEVEAEPALDERSIRIKLPTGFMQYFFNSEWHTSKEEAVARAEVMRKNKIKSLERSIAKLENMKF